MLSISVGGETGIVPLYSLPKTDSKNLEADLYAALEKEYRNANISPTVYEVTAGNVRPGIHGLSGPNGAVVRGEFEPQRADVPGIPVQSQELKYLQDPEVGAALADHPEMLIPTETGQAVSQPNSGVRRPSASRADGFSPQAADILRGGACLCQNFCQK